MDLGNIFILGDSYSTFTGIIPEGYSAWYTPTPKPETDVTRAEEIWHQRLLEQLPGKIIMNDSWSGSTVCCTGYDGKDFSHCAFINRLDNYLARGFFRENRIDTLLVLGATNDSWSDAPVGQLQYDGWTKEDLYRVLPAVGYLTRRLAENFPDTRLLYIVNDGLKEEITQGILDACGHFRIPALRLKDIDKLAGHPTVAGMQQIADQVAAYFQSTIF
jgi:hypothetical protein